MPRLQRRKSNASGFYCRLQTCGGTGIRVEHQDVFKVLQEVAEKRIETVKIASGFRSIFLKTLEKSFNRQLSLQLT
jgi:hypothetical protein